MLVDLVHILIGRVFGHVDGDEHHQLAAVAADDDTLRLPAPQAPDIPGQMGFEVVHAHDRERVLRVHRIFPARRKSGPALTI